MDHPSEMEQRIAAPFHEMAGARSAIDQLIPVRDLPTYTGHSRATNYQLMKDGELGFVKIGSRRFVPLSECARWIEEQKRRARTEGTLLNRAQA